MLFYDFHGDENTTVVVVPGPRLRRGIPGKPRNARQEGGNDNVRTTH